MFLTYQDAVQHVLDYLGAGVTESVVRDARRSVTEAYNEFGSAHTWSYLYTHGRIITNAPYQTGTIAYDHTGGAYERMVTLSGGTWPATAPFCYLRVGTVAYRISQRKSATVVTLDAHVNPGADLASGTEYLMYQDTYALPDDYIRQDQALYESNFGGMTFCHPKEWLYENRYIFAEGIPQQYTITGDAAVPGKLVIRLLPWPVENKTIDFIYQRQPRAINLASLPAVASIGSGSSAVTATTAVFLPHMVGSVIRLSGNTVAPTGEVGGATLYNPAAFESVIAAFISTTQVMTMDASDNALSSVSAVISDPIEIERSSMQNAFLRCCEKHVGMHRTLKDKPSARLQYNEALEDARASDSRSFAGRHCGPAYRFRQRLRDMPQGPDQ